MTTNFISIFNQIKICSASAANARCVHTSALRSRKKVATQHEAALATFNKMKTDDELVVLQGGHKAAASYLERVAAHQKFMEAKIAEFDISKRHLARMMGEDPDTFTQEDINRGIEYLLPSGLFQPMARPHMLPPEKVFAKKKDAQFDHTGRPYHNLFYTTLPNYYQTMHSVAETMKDLDRYEDGKIRDSSELIDRIQLDGFFWKSHTQLEEILLEKIDENMYDKFIIAMDRLCAHPYSNKARKFVEAYIEANKTESDADSKTLLEYTEEGRAFAIAVGTRKMAKANVKVYGDGSGKFTCNGINILYFEQALEREQIAVPLIMTGLMGKVDIVCRVERSGVSAQAGAVRYALSKALTAFVDDAMVERMRIAGLLTLDDRRSERKRPGQRAARAKFTWRKR